MPSWNQFMLQDATSYIMQLLIRFHDHAMTVLVLILSIVGCASIALLNNKLSSRNLLEAQQIETMWTVLPALTLIFLAIPSLRLLYLMDELKNPHLTVKAIAHQWYWSYEYGAHKALQFDSYMSPTNDLLSGELRLLEVDNRTIIPSNTEIRFLVTSADVIHAWAIPSLGVKVDAIPGRLNQLSLTTNKPGVFYGQCSEICGANHSFMPIVVESLPYNQFIKWFTSKTTPDYQPPSLDEQAFNFFKNINPYKMCTKVRQPNPRTYSVSW